VEVKKPVPPPADKKEPAKPAETFEPPAPKTINWDDVVADGKTKLKAVFEFKALEADELSLSVGDEIMLITKVDDLWFKGEKGGKVGIFPKEFVAPLSFASSHVLATSLSSPNLSGGLKPSTSTEDIRSSDVSESIDGLHHEKRLEVPKKAGGPANRRPPSRKSNFNFEEGASPLDKPAPAPIIKPEKPIEKAVEKPVEDKKTNKTPPPPKAKEIKPAETKPVEKPVETKPVEKPAEPKVEDKPKEDTAITKAPKMPGIKTGNTIIVTLKEATGNFRSIENLPEGIKRVMFNFESESTDHPADTLVVVFKDGQLDAVHHNNKKIAHALKLV